MVATLLVPLAVANAPAGRYSYTAASAVAIDTKTNLTWQRVAATTVMPWDAAKTYCASTDLSSVLGGSGWRLPTVKELQTLVDYSLLTGPLIDPDAFPLTANDFFWSATISATSFQAWGV